MLQDCLCVLVCLVKYFKSCTLMLSINKKVFENLWLDKKEIAIISFELVVFFRGTAKYCKNNRYHILSSFRFQEKSLAIKNKSQTSLVNGLFGVPVSKEQKPFKAKLQPCCFLYTLYREMPDLSK